MNLKLLLGVNFFEKNNNSTKGKFDSNNVTANLVISISNLFSSIFFLFISFGVYL